MFIINPPAVRPSEPPLALARLAAHLRSRGVACEVLDLNLEASLALLRGDVKSEGLGNSAIHALRRRSGNLELLRQWEGYENFARYERAVRGLELSLRAAARAHAGLMETRMGSPGLADYKEEGRSPLMRHDLVDAAAHPEDSPYAAFMEARVRTAIRDGGWKTIGISLGYLSQVLPAFTLIGILRHIDPGLKILLGGALLNSWLACGAITEQENFSGLVDSILFGRGEEALDSHLGLKAAERAVPDFDGLPLDDYLSPTRILPYAFSEGCAWRKCRFCPERAEGHSYHSMRVLEAHSQLTAIVKRWKPGFIHFTDSEIPLPVLRILAQRPLGTSWYGFARFGAELADVDFCRSLARSGCVMLQLGLESADQAVLDANEKGTRIEVISACLEALHAAGIGTYIYLLFGTPEEDREAALKTRDFVAQRAGQIDYLNLAIFNMPVGGPDAALLGDRVFYPGDLSLYTGFTHPKDWNREDVRSFVQGEFQESTALREIVARTPPVFSSNHAPLFLFPRSRKTQGIGQG